jgi:ribosomal protein S18 acetylase RimI-like enzyme
LDTPIEIRELALDELALIGEIDRTEHIEVLFEQRGIELVARHGDWSAPPWLTDSDGEHSVAAQRRAILHYVDAGGIARGAFAGERLVGIAVVVPHIRPGIAQLAYLHVSNGSRAAGVGRALCDELDRIAREAGDTTMVVSATPSENTVRFYMFRGFRPMPQPLPELFEQEPEDVHMQKPL